MDARAKISLGSALVSIAGAGVVLAIAGRLEKRRSE
jgi:hypothetical protein